MSKATFAMFSKIIRHRYSRFSDAIHYAPTVCLCVLWVFVVRLFSTVYRTLLKHQLRGIIGIFLVCLMAGCGTPQRAIVEREFPEYADAEAGRLLIIDYGCGACHTIEGIRSANGVVGAPLVDYEAQHYIAGEMPNNAVNLALWIQNPQEIEPDTAMPNLGVSYEEAMDMVAYFYSR